MSCSTQIVGGQGAPEVRPTLFEDSLFVENIQSWDGTFVRPEGWYMLRLQEHSSRVNKKRTIINRRRPSAQQRHPYLEFLSDGHCVI